MDVPWKQKIFLYFEKYAHLLLGVMLFLILLELLKRLKSCSLLRISDKYSYSVYIVHQLLILSPFSLMGLTKYSIVNCIVITIGLLAFVVNILSSRIIKNIKFEV